MRRSLLLFLLSLFAFQAEASSPGHGGSFGLVSGGELEHGTWGPGVKTDAGFSPIPNGPTPIFELTGENGTLSQNLTINGTTVAPTFLYEGKNASASGWTATAGTDLTAAGSGGNFSAPSPVGIDDTVEDKGSRYYTLSQAISLGTTDDIAFELLVRLGPPPAVGTKTIAFSDDGSAGWRVVQTSTDRLQFYLDAGAERITPEAVAIGQGWQHVLFAWDRTNDRVQIFVQGAESFDSSSQSAAGEIVSSAASTAFLANTSGTAGLEGAVARIGLYLAPAGAFGNADIDNLAEERFYRLIGAGAGDTFPTTATRSSAGYLTKANSSGDNQLFYVGENWPRVGSYNDGTTTRNAVQIEGSATNLATYSETFTVDWTKLRNANSGTSTTVLSPDPSKFAHEVIPDVQANSNYPTRYGGISFSAGAYTSSVYARAGNQDWLYLTLFDGTTNYQAYFDLANGVVGSTPQNPDAYIEEVEDDWYRCIISATLAAGTGQVDIFPAEADGDITFAGDGSTVSTYIFGAQLETGAYASSYIPTTSASATRAEDALEYTLPALAPPYTVSVSARKLVSSFGGIVALSDGGTTNDRSLIADFGSDTYRFQAVSSGTTVANIPETSVTSGWQDMAAVTATDAFEFFVDGVSSGTDTSGTAPDDIDRLRVGAYQSGGNIRGGFVGLPLRIYDQVVEP